MKNHIHHLILALILMDRASLGHTADLDPPATNIMPSVSVTVSFDGQSTFEYSYKITSSSSSLQDIDNFALKVGTSPVARAINSPENWDNVPNTFGTRGTIAWGSIESGRIKPGSSSGGFSIISYFLPDVRVSMLRGFVPMPQVDFVDENTPVPRDPETDSIHLQTIGPSTFTFTESLSAADRLISLKHQSVSLNWLRGKEFIAELDEKLDQSRKALAESKPQEARDKLREFIHELEEQRKEQLERQHEASEEGREEREEHSDDDKKFISDNAFYLLKPNAEYIISKLPVKPEDDDGRSKDDGH